MSGTPGIGRRPDQLPLGVSLRHKRSFSNFVCGENRAAVAMLRNVVAGRGAGAVYLWGGPGSGKSHLLEACCGDQAMHGRPVAYLSLGSAQAQPDMLAGLAGVQLLCLDDIDRVSGHDGWEEALFHLYNQAEQSACPMVLAGAVAPRTAPWRLADLASRLNAAVVWRLQALDDDGRREALQLHARERGFDLSDEVVTFVMKRLRRDMVSLSQFLERLDHSSLAAQRRITVPFVKTLLEDDA